MQPVTRKIRIVSGSIVDQPDADAIVNAANEQLRAGGGVCGFIFRAAGARELQEECWGVDHPIIGPDNCRVPTGMATVTKGHKLPNKFIIHAVGPIYDEDQPDLMNQLLHSAYTSSLTNAEASGCRIVAFPAISCGVYGYPWEDAAHVALSTCDEWFKGHPSSVVEEIRFVIFEPGLLSIFEDEGKKLLETP